MSVEEYLRELGRRLSVGPVRRRRILRELEAHLLDATAEEERGGRSRQDAERRATERLGSVDDLAARFGARRRSRTTRRLVAISVGVSVAATAAFALPMVLVDSGESHAVSRVARIVCGGENAKQTCVDAVERSCDADSPGTQATIWTPGGPTPAHAWCRKVLRG